MKMNMKNITKFLSIILISVFVMSLSTNVFAGAFLNASEFDNIDKATNVTNMVTNAAETTVSETPTTTPSSERVILGIEDMSRTIGMALAGFGAIMLTALIWLYLRSKKA